MCIVSRSCYATEVLNERALHVLGATAYRDSIVYLYAAFSANTAS